MKVRKAPGAPLRFKSAYILFSTTKHKQIRSSSHQKMTTPQVAKMVSQAWKSLPAHERAAWDEGARQDRVRYEREKAAYHGPWKIIAPRHQSTKKPAALRGAANADFGLEHRTMAQSTNPGATRLALEGIVPPMQQETDPLTRKFYAGREAPPQKHVQTAVSMSEMEPQHQKCVNEESILRNTEKQAQSILERQAVVNAKDWFAAEIWMSNRVKAVQSATMKRLYPTASSKSTASATSETSYHSTSEPAQKAALNAPSSSSSCIVPLIASDENCLLAVAAYIDAKEGSTMPTEAIHENHHFNEQVEQVLASLPESFCDADLTEF